MTLMLPELIIVATAFLVLMLDIVAPNDDRKGWTAYVALAGIAVALGFVIANMGVTADALGGRFAVDPIGSWFKLIFLIATFITITISGEAKLKSQGEFWTILLFVLSGMMFLASARDLVSLYVSLELATIPLMVLTAWPRDTRSGEGAIKYVIVGALASALLLYGLGLLYGLTGSMSFDAIAKAVKPSPAMWLTAGLLTAGIGFKLTLFPFHMWAPDVYEGAPTPMTAYLSVASKAAGMVLSFHIFYKIFGGLLADWTLIIAILATATMTLGNVVAVLQTNIKRFMAYSAISQAGYLIFGFLGTAEQDITAMVFYLFVYVLTNLAAFAVIIARVEQSGKEDLSAFRGLSRTNPVLALAFMIALFGLAGIPPLAGFVGKLFLFSVAAKYGYYWLVAVAALNSTVSLYYYLRIVRQMYIEPVDTTIKPLTVSPTFIVGLSIATLGSVICGILPMFYEAVSSSASHWLTKVANF